MPNQIEIGIQSKMFDNFALSCYRNCPAYYEKRIVKKVNKLGAKKTAADFGSAIHAGLEHYYKEGMTDQAISESLQVFIDTFTPHQDDADDKRTLGKGLEILMKYFDRYRHEPFNVIATEVGGACELEDYMYTVRIDMAVEWLSPKGIYGFDHKTTSSLHRMVVKPNNQVTGYDYYLKEMYENVLGYMINAIGVYKEAEEMDKGAPKVPSPKTGKMIYAKKEREILVRMPTSRTQSELKAWKEQTLHLIHQIEESTEKNIWPKHAPEYCTAYRGRCQYIDLCQGQDEDKILQVLIASGIYQIEPWVPYVGVGVEEEEEDG